MEKLSKTETLVVPVAGILNVEAGEHSTAELHFSRLSRKMEKTLGIAVARPIVPVGLGVLQSSKAIYEHFAKEVDARVQANDQARVLFLGHSLGGLLCREFLARNYSRTERYIGAVTLGSPHLQVDERQWMGLYRGVVRNIDRFINNIPMLDSPEEGGPDLHFVAASNDAVVPPSNALPDFPGATRSLLLGYNQKPPYDIDMDKVTTFRMFPVGHNSMLVQPQATNAITSIVANALGAQPEYASNIEPAQFDTPLSLVRPA